MALIPSIHKLQHFLSGNPAILLVKESRRVPDLIKEVRSRGIPVVLTSHNKPHVFEVADTIHVHRMGKRHCVIDAKNYSMSDAVALMTGALQVDAAWRPIV